MHDHDLIAGDEEPEFSQLCNLIEKKRRKLVQLYVTRDLRSQSQAQLKACVWEIRKNTVAHQSDLPLAELQLSYLLPRTAAPVSLVDHVDNDVRPWIDDADFVVDDEIAVIAIVWEECEHDRGDSEQANMTWYPSAHVMIEIHPCEARTIVIERAMQAFPFLRPELVASLLDLIVALCNTLLQASFVCLAALLACYGFLTGAQRSISSGLSGLSQLTLGPQLPVLIKSSRLGVPQALAALR